MVILQHADDVLRGRPWTILQGGTRRRLIQLAGLLTAFGLVYGSVMGGYGASTGRWTVQPLISAVKVPVLLIVTFSVAMPSFFVVNTLLGLRDDFRQAARALMATQAALTIILASLAPVTAFWYASYDNYNAAILFNALMFGVAAFAAQIVLRRYYRPLIQRNRRHRPMLWAWLILYAFIGIQMGWVLRPFIGDPELPPRLFRQSAWGNAYVEVFDTLWKLIAGG